MLAPFENLFWIGIKGIWSQWKNSLVLVTPETVVGWHRAGFRRYWRWRSRCRAGRKPVNREIRELIIRMVSENPTWGATGIHGECTVVVHKNLIGDLQDSEIARAFRGLAGPAESPLAFLTEQPKDF